uniref:C-type lectin domain-containing protein n=1 Tax=Labrus bergylta TaxID=56723 RepID=A0A3Q3FJY0_9LABR
SNSASAFKYEKREVSDPCIAVKNVTFLVSGQCFLVTCHHIEYHLIEEAKTWDEAQRYCKEKYTDLATVSDMTDMKRIPEIVNTQEAWIGLQNNPGQTYFHNKEPNDHNNKPENCVTSMKPKTDTSATLKPADKRILCSSRSRLCPALLC